MVFYDRRVTRNDRRMTLHFSIPNFGVPYFSRVPSIGYLILKEIWYFRYFIYVIILFIKQLHVAIHNNV